MKKSKTSQRWLTEHEQDPFVQKARLAGYRSRAVYKLIEIDDRLRLLKPGQVVVDLGAAPGGWSQIARARVGPKGRVIALDVLEMSPIEGVEVIKGDFTEGNVLDQLLERIKDDRIDLVISDMAPNLSGMRAVDLPRSAYLVELALEFAEKMLKPGGNLLVKAFEGEGIDTLRLQFRKSFGKYVNLKPKASRGRSREIYLAGLGKNAL